MAQLAIYIDEKTAKALKKVSRKSRLSRSEWVSRIIKRELEDKFSDDFFRILGSWEDDRTPDEILRDIRKGAVQKERTSLR